MSLRAALARRSLPQPNASTCRSQSVTSSSRKPRGQYFRLLHEHPSFSSRQPGRRRKVVLRPRLQQRTGKSSPQSPMSTSSKSPFSGVFSSRWLSTAAPAASSTSSPKSKKSAKPEKQAIGAIAHGGIDDASKPTTLEILRVLSTNLWPEDKAMKRRVVAAVGFLVGAKIANVQVPFMFKHAVDSLNISVEQFTATGAAMTIPLAVLLGWGAARTTSSLFNELRSAVFAPVAQAGIRKVARTTFKHLHDMDLSFHLNRNTGALSRAIDRGQRGINFILNAMLFNVVPTILEIGLVCGILGNQYGASFAGVTLSTIGVYCVYTIAITQWRTKFRVKMNALDNEANNKAIDSLINYETVKYFNNEDLEVSRYDSVLRGYQKMALQVQTSLSALNWGQNVVFSVGLTTMMVMAANGVAAGTMTVGDLVMVNGLLFQLSHPLNFVGSTFREIRQSTIDLEVMIGLMSLKTKLLAKPDAKPLKINGGTVKFDNVKFGYRDDSNILDGTSFEVPAGKSVAVVGSSGSGKSTILRLLYRFYDSQGGTVSIDGQDVKDVQLQSLRKTIGVVPQDTVLFNDTIYYNIAYGKRDATPDEVYAAAKKAQIHDIVTQMPLGYETQVGERGLKLSGGEKQRVAIARMILKDTPIILCDEATSSLDTHTESEILSALKKTVRDRTSIFVAHRLSTVVDVDEIIVLDKGKVVERGNHEQLLATPGSKYGALWDLQARQQQKHLQEQRDRERHEQEKLEE